MADLSLAAMSLVLVVSFGICVVATSLAMESAALFVPAFLVVFPAVIDGFPTITGNAAIGLTLLIMFFGQTSAVAGYWYRGQIDMRVARSIVVVTVPVAVIGRFGGYLVPERVLLGAFAAILFGLAGLVTYGRLGGFTPERTPGRPGSEPGGARAGLDRGERVAVVTGGLLAGLVGFAIGEITNASLHLRRRLSIKRSTGTSTLVLYVTLAAANLTNLGIVFAGPESIAGSIAVPWSVGLLIAPVVVIGGQVGAFVNSTLSERTVIGSLVATYLVVGVVTLHRAMG